MRFCRAALTLVVLALLTGLQAAPGPYVLCVSRCEIGDTGETVEMVCWSGPSKTGCSVLSDNNRDGDCGGCGSVEDEVTAEVGCCVADASCPPFESCPQFPSDGKDDCPYGQPDCFWCLPGSVIADRTPQATQNTADHGQVVLGHATAQLLQSDLALQVSHSHSPPGPLLAASGSDICIEICLLLI